MANLSISGKGPNSKITLAHIHAGQGSFKQDTGTIHSQVALMQSALTAQGYSTKGIDGKFGKDTLAAVKNFQAAKMLTVDGCFGKNSLLALEADIGGHLDPDNCTSSTNDIDKIDGSHESSAYKTMQGTRVNSYPDAVSEIATFSSNNPNLLKVSAYKSNLDTIASNPATTYDRLDCSDYVKQAKNNQGYHGSTTIFCNNCIYFGFIPQLGGYDNLIPGMELYQGCRKNNTSSQYYTSHVGVYAGKYDFGDGKGLQHAVYQSSPNFGSLAVKYTKNKERNGNRNGPNLSAMSTAWNYWSWSKYVTQD